jgi:hypothetical protein
VWLVSPRPLPAVATMPGVSAIWVGPDECGAGLPAGHPASCACEDFNSLVRDAGPGEREMAGLSVATARQLRRQHDIEAAVLATAAVLLGRPSPEVMAGARVRVARDARTLVTGRRTTVAVPECARALVRGWAGRSLLPRDWAGDVAACRARKPDLWP